MAASDDKELKKAQPAAAQAPPPKKTTAAVLNDDEEVHERPLDWAMTVRLMRYLKPYAGRMAGVVVLVAVTTALALLVTKAISTIVQHLGAGQGEQAMRWTIILAAAAVGAWAIDWWRGWALMSVGQKVLFDLRTMIFRHLQTLSLSYFDRTKAGWIISRADRKSVV